MPPVNESARRQIDALTLDRKRPLVITDADEVIVSFARPLENFLHRQGMALHIRDYRLLGNVHYTETGKAVGRETLFGLIDDFFAAEVDRLPLVPGAAAGLSALSERGQVVVLTNLPEVYLDRRIAAFEALGIRAPIIANSGLKGAPAHALSLMVSSPVVFIDDIDQHIASVAESVPESYRIHYIADHRLAAVCPPAPTSHHRADDWPDIVDAIGRHIRDRGF